MNNVVMTNQKKKRKGFTLIELIIVLAVMAIIAAIAIPNLAGVKNNAAIKTDQESAKTIERAVEVLIADDTLKGTSGSFKVKADGTIESTGLTVTPASDKDNVVKAITSALGGIKGPQAEKKDHFLVKITDGAVNVETGGTAE